MRIRYNAPVILTFTLIATAVLVLDQFLSSALTRNFFIAYPTFQPARLVSYFRLFAHVIGHRSWLHMISNFSFILLIGPILEEKYHSATMLAMMLVTALVTGILNIVFFSTGLMGASGIVFMLIILSSFTNISAGDVPLTFILIVVLFLAKEIIAAFSEDNISQFAHIVGGSCGGLFGFLLIRGRRA